MMSVLSIAPAFLASSASPTPGYHDAGELAIPATVMVAIIASLAWCVFQKKKPGLQPACASSLWLILSGLIIPISGSVVLKIFGTSVPANVATTIGIVLTGLGILAFVAGFITAVVGLICYDKTRHDSGRGRAIWALVLSVLILASVSVAIAIPILSRINKLAAERSAELSQKTQLPSATPGVTAPLKFPEYNFEIDHPGFGWKENRKVTTVNPDVCLAVVRQAPFAGMNVIAESYGNTGAVGNELIAELAQLQLRQKARSVSFSKTEPAILGGIPFLHFSGVATIPRFPDELFYDYYVSTHNGFGYQIIAFSKAADKVERSKEFREIVNTFSLIDPERESVSHYEAITDVRDTAFGFETALLPIGDWKADPTRDSAPPDPGIRFLATEVPMHTLSVEPFRLTSAPVPIEVLAEVSLATMESPPSPEAVATRKIAVPGADAALEVEADIDIEGIRAHFIRRVVKVGEIAYFVSLVSFTPDDQQALLKGKAALDAVTFFPPHPGPHPIFEDEDFLEAEALLINQTGIACYNRRDFSTASTFFEKAAETLPGDFDFFANTIRSYTAAGDYESALARFDSHGKPFSTLPAANSLQASVEAAAGETDAAIARYSKLFASGHKGEDDLHSYLQILLTAERFDEAKHAADTYAETHPSAGAGHLRASVYLDAGEEAESVAQLEALRSRYPSNVETLYVLGETCNAAGLPEKSAACVDTLLAKGYDSARTHVIRGYSELHQDRHADAKLAFEKAVEKDSLNEEAQLGLKVAQSRLGQGSQENIRKPIDPVPIPEAIAQDLRNNEGRITSPAGMAFLHNLTGIAFEKGRTFRTTYYKKILVPDLKAAEQASTLTYGFNPSAERIFVNKLTVKDTSGKTVGTGNISDYYVIDDTSTGMATSDRTLHLPVPGVQPGTVIEAVVTTETLTSRDEIPFTSKALVSLVPCSSVGLFITGDTGDTKSSVSGNPEVFSGNGYTGWNIHPEEPFHLEAAQPPISDFVPFVRIAPGDKEWITIGRAYIDRIEGRIHPDSDVQKMADEITGDADSAADKASKITRFVQDSLRYEAIEFGSRGQVPNTASQTLKNLYGDCKDHSVLLHQLLHAKGIESHLALVSTGGDIDTDLPHLDQFDHMIVWVAEDGGTFVDATQKNLPYGALPPDYLAGHHALVLDPDSPRIIQIRNAPVDAFMVESSRSVSSSTDGTAHITETLSLQGYAASRLRTFFRDRPEDSTIDDIQRTLGTYANLKVQSARLENLRTTTLPLKLRMSYDIPEHFLATDSGMTGRLPALWERHFLEVAHSKDRKSPFVLGDPTTFTSNIFVENEPTFGAGDIADIPNSQSGDFGEWTVSRGSKDSATLLRFEFKSGTRHFPAPRYADYETARATAMGSLRRQITIRPAPLRIGVAGNPL